ncbi:hypothetical protein BO70DRAFT_372162 [Aspergillus heteromorphus CBS 117.55]|uniref:Cytochrome b5 heme-binding domain-containing protein n=1 Tax=Aspergillus heteromorphus CBS 117.55 TaxID=1448321 RepID=A0A317VWL7_9EURO|nr:uncharacterized protein BO70DRAFT_372162 [Aspergillus heteromorphus CBS 117.55]PWY77407.1 hypothetical protein BO70DRAFT_372162 [Aspergillus heteromorphus CBS 117.55]
MPAQPAKHMEELLHPLQHLLALLGLLRPRINWFNLTILLLIPLDAAHEIPKIPLRCYTLLWSLGYYFITMLCITAGYHRLWSHRSYNASKPLQWFLAVFGAGAMQGSIRSWRDQGEIPPPRYPIEMSDLAEDSVLDTQDQYYRALSLFMGWIFPAFVAGLGWGDWKGGVLDAGILRAFFVQQATFSVNPLAHWVGGQPYGDRRSARNSGWVAVVTLGEGYHNFHHEFPGDYRCGVEWWQVDVTKWMIFGWMVVGMAGGLKRFSRGQRKLNIESRFVYDVGEFMKEHPGGERLPELYIKGDVTYEFNGDVYNHSDEARDRLAMMRVAVRP